MLIASLTVVPLWGWLRRMFDDRLAVIACLVYALHGKLIAISPLIIRDSTFWFLLVLTLYCSGGRWANCASAFSWLPASR